MCAITRPSTWRWVRSSSSLSIWSLNTRATKSGRSDQWEAPTRRSSCTSSGHSGLHVAVMNRLGALRARTMARASWYSCNMWRGLPMMVDGRMMLRPMLAAAAVASERSASRTPLYRSTRRMCWLRSHHCKRWCSVLANSSTNSSWNRRRPLLMLLLWSGRSCKVRVWRWPAQRTGWLAVHAVQCAVDS
jgi:hypothetical protein